MGFARPPSITQLYRMHIQQAATGPLPQIWGGIECTINRVGNQYLDQCQYSGHYNRGRTDLDLIAGLGLRMLRYPVLWEKHQPQQHQPGDWTFVNTQLAHMQQCGITPIVGLVHHGSGPAWVNFFDGSFEQGLARYVYEVATRFPHLEYYTPVNEPLTTARFCGLYGHWYPHKKDDFSFYTILLAECKATVLAMQAIRQINPEAKLVQTEDLGKCYSTPLLQYQAQMENHRRWLSYDLLCGRVNEAHPMWPVLMEAGMEADAVLWFTENFCVPWVAGFNYYITSERYLDENLHHYPEEYHGGNSRHRYADIEVVRSPLDEPHGPEVLLREAAAHLRLPLAVTECHLNAGREDQIRWFHRMVQIAAQLNREGIPIKAVTAWAVLGLWGWNRLVTQPGGDYETGVFKYCGGSMQPTAIAHYIKKIIAHQNCTHPLLTGEGWWQRPDRLRYGTPKIVSMQVNKPKPDAAPLLILGKSGTLGAAFARICAQRHIHHVVLSRADVDLTQTSQIAHTLQGLKPWAVVNATGYVRVDDAEKDADVCFAVNTDAAVEVARQCAALDVPYLNFSTDLVFDGSKEEPYMESDAVNPLNIYGRSKAMAEEQILQVHPQALIVRTAAFFGPWDVHNFAHHTLQSLQNGQTVQAAADVAMSPTYVPHLVDACLQLLMDGAAGVRHLTNGEVLSWADAARKVAAVAGYSPHQVQEQEAKQIDWAAARPRYSALGTQFHSAMPSFDQALQEWAAAVLDVAVKRWIA